MRLRSGLALFVTLVAACGFGGGAEPDGDQSVDATGNDSAATDAGTDASGSSIDDARGDGGLPGWDGGLGGWDGGLGGWDGGLGGWDGGLPF